MKLLVVGHSYVTPFAQEKYVAMKALRRDLAVRLVVPPAVRHPFGSYRPALADGLSPEELVVVRSFGGSTNMTYLLEPIALGSLMKHFAPTHVHIEEDPHSAVGVEAAFLAASICPRARLSFFIWDNLNRTPPFPRNILKHRLTRFGFTRSRLVVCGNQQARVLLAAKGYHGATAVIPQIGLGPVAVDHAASRSNPADRALTIGYFGRLVPEKGMLDLLEALEGLRDRSWRLIIRGSGPLRNEIEHRWQGIFREKLVCLEPIPHADVTKELSAVNIFVLPSYSTPIWKEQFGLTLAQAMLAGCACIGSSSGAIPEVLSGNGILFPERDVLALTEALCHLLDSPAERLRLGAAARAFAQAHYTNEVIAQRYLHAFEAVAS